MSKTLFTKKGKYKKNPYTCKLFPLKNWKKLPKVDQVQAVCFLNENQIVFYQNVNGQLGNPGGGPEGKESPEQTLKRELIEEAQLKLIDWKTIGYEKLDYKKNGKTFKTHYFLRAIAKVELIDAKVKDPDGKGIGRTVVNKKDAVETLNWGEKGEILLNLALENHGKLFN